MTVKILGVEFKRYYEDSQAWPDGWWHEDEEITINGFDGDGDVDLSAVKDSDVITLKGGAIYKGGYDFEGSSMESHFKQWRKKQTTAVIVVEVPVEMVDTFRETVAKAGGKVLK